ncbi:MAG: Argininosuccinate lyase [Gammaproteobacteria bacterium]|nr:Argininosuccinate lyase [Gammaproteobacteria bacterium]
MSNDKPWGGRFGEETHELVEDFTESVSFDKALYRYDIQGSIAHARMLSQVGVLIREECDAIVEGLNTIARDIEQDNFSWSARLEDVHMNIEAELTERIGDVGKKLHTARSRNDQIATDLRLYLREAVDNILERLVELRRTLLDLAESEVETVMPGFTHLQVAQPVTLGHHVLAWLSMLERDSQRFSEARVRINILPLGAAALAGTTFGIDRQYTAEQLGFDGIADNSLDAVSDRDFVIECSAHASLLMVHLSRIAEELILWQSEAYKFIEIGDAFCTGSSIMPQKKNPDVAELLRGKSGRAIGNLVSLLTLMKGQPLAYNRDNQEDKEPIFDTVKTVCACLAVLAAMVPTISVNRSRMRDAASQGFATATDLADYLVRKGVPFRDAHEAVGKVVAECLADGIALTDLALDRLRQHHASIDSDIFDMLSLEGSVSARNHLGGTAPEQVRAAIARHRANLPS